MATLTETFTNIADAIRSKTETTDKITPENMPAMIEGISVGAAEPVIQELSITSNGTYRAPEGIDGYTPITVNVPQDGGPTAEELTISGSCDYKFYSGCWDWFVNKYGNQITTEKISSIMNMFCNSKLESIPFDINTTGASGLHLNSVFKSCSKLKKAPVINNLNPGDMNYIFDGCNNLREIPDNFCDTWDWSYIENTTSAYTGNQSCMFRDCYSLRKIPQELISHGNPKITSGYGIYKEGFQNCYVLDEIVGLMVYTGATYTSNMFKSGVYYGAFVRCNRLKRLTFATNEDGTPKVVNWKSQLIDLGTASNGFMVGYAYSENAILNYNSGLTVDTRIYDDATYQALKDNPDSWTDYSDYSRYNKTSAIETINSLPDTSAYLAANGGTNTIQFYGSAGSKTDGGAINTMTEEEIAVATAKGWTVSFV